MCTGAEGEQMHVRIRERWARAQRWRMRQRSGQEPGKAFVRGLDFGLKDMGNTGRKMLKLLSFSKQSSPCLFHCLCGSRHPPPPQHPGQICRIQDHLASCCGMYQPHLGFTCCLAPPQSRTCIFSLYQPVTSLGAETGSLKPEVSCSSYHS